MIVRNLIHKARDNRNLQFDYSWLVIRRSREREKSRENFITGTSCKWHVSLKVPTVHFSSESIFQKKNNNIQIYSNPSPRTQRRPADPTSGWLLHTSNGTTLKKQNIQILYRLQARSNLFLLTVHWGYHILTLTILPGRYSPHFQRSLENQLLKRFLLSGQLYV